MTIWLLSVNFVFDAVGLRYAVKIIARFYTVQYEHTKRDVVACAFVFVSNILEYVSAKNWQDRMKSEKDITTIKRVKFLWDSVDLNFAYALCYLKTNPGNHVQTVWPAFESKNSHDQRLDIPSPWSGMASFYTSVLYIRILTFGVGRLLHLPSAEAVSVRPNAQPRCYQKVTVIGYEAKIGCEAEQITSHLGLVTCSMVVPIRRSALS